MPMETDSNAEGATDSESCDSDAAPVWHATDEDMERESVDKFVSETYGCHFGPKSTAFSTLARLDIRKQPVLLLNAHNCCSAAIMHVCIVLCCILLWNLHY